MPPLSLRYRRTHTLCTPPTPPAACVMARAQKPADVRMDGSFDVTVEKLIRHWCPTLEEKDLKWVHQLDFGAWATATTFTRLDRSMNLGTRLF